MVTKMRIREDSTKLSLTGGKMTGDIDMSLNRIINVPVPING